MTLLLLNRRPLLDRLASWFPDCAEELVVVTDPSALGDAGPAAWSGRFRHLEVVDDYAAPETGDLVERLVRAHAVERILTTAESDVLRAARLRHRLGLPGQTGASALAYRDKQVMKSLAGAAGVPVAPMRLVHDGAELADFAREHGLPVVVKAVDGVACLGQRVLTDQRSLREPGTGPWPAPLLAEAWIEGDTFHVDGLMADGAVLLSHPSRYLNSQWLTHHGSAPLVSGMLAPDDPLFARLQRAVRDVVRALPGPAGACAFHAEFFRTADDRIVLCEIACRAGGGSIVEAFELATGVNLHGASLLGQAGRAVDLPGPGTVLRHGYATWYPPVETATLRRLPRHCPLPGTVKYVPSGRVGHRYHGPDSPSHRVADLFFRLPDGGTGDGLTDRLREVDRWWAGAAQWDFADAAEVPAARPEHA
ncbi:hypothetical protein PUR71_08465 [Streptomyces sp. SP17BM10]|uniref:ATP-grasp domain-containing protein n=1 Tax=Streptomyces sp. SP17BM10 TaxID=3002530 RepID=UPI002E79238B|nr:hypothetical protein [Streptomyces sp. SP17BM10]MEE1782948.1 hypothetical protein [Streptomyces sp. SP17BM10]